MFQESPLAMIGICLFVLVVLAPALLIALFFPLGVLGIPVLASCVASIVLSSGGN